MNSMKSINLTQAAIYQNLSTMLRRSAVRHADRPCITCGATQWTYAEFNALVDQFARGLTRYGIAKGDRVAVLARNSHSFMVLRFAVARLGAVLVPVNFMLVAEEANYILVHSEARILFIDPSTERLGREAALSGIEKIFSLSGEFD